MSFESFVEKEKDKVENFIQEDKKHHEDLHVTFQPLNNMDRLTGKIIWID